MRQFGFHFGGKKGLRGRQLRLEALEERALLAVSAGSEIADYSAMTDGDQNTWVVTTLSDVVDEEDGVLSLREAIAAAEAAKLDSAVITFDSALADGTIMLNRTELSVSCELLIDGSGLDITIDAKSQSRVFNIKTTEDIVELKGLTLTGGKTADNGGAILTGSGTLLLTDCVVSSSTATNGGGVYVSNGSLTITNTVFSGNNASNDAGAVCAVGASLTLNSVQVTNNTAGNCAGGISSVSSLFTAVNTLIANNSARGYGGVYVEQESATFTNCTITQNYASGNYNTGGLRASRTTVNLYNSIVCGNAYSRGAFDIENSGSTINGYNTLSDFTAWTTSDSCITYDATRPLFQNCAAGDFSLAAKSQAIDLGDNYYVSTETDLAGNRRIVSGTVDLGACESFAWGWRGFADGTAHSVTLSKMVKGDAVSFSLDGGETWSETNPEFTKVGSYSVMVKLERSGYADWTANLSIDILAKDALVVTTLDDIVDEEDDFLSLREALSIARKGDTITFDESLADGTIKLRKSELKIAESLTIDASGLNITITPASSNASRIFHIAKGVESAELIGLTITGGNVTGNGGAILAELFVGLSLTDCTVSSSIATESGGGICLACGSLSLQNCVVTGNSATYNGGAVYVQGGTLTLDSVRVTNNSAYNSGGIGSYYTRLTAVNTLIANNSGNYNGGVCVEGESGTFINCTITQNYASGYYYAGGLRASRTTVNLYNSIVCVNYNYRGAFDIENDGSTINGYNTLSDFTAWTTSDSCVTYDAALPLFQNRAAGDFSLAANSQAVNLGENDYTASKTDLAGNRRIVSGTVDLGAYESFAWSWRGYADGNAHSVTLSKMVKGDTVSFSLDGGQTWSETNPEFTKVGSYSVKVKLERSGYADWTANLSVDILAKDALVVTTLDDIVDEEDDFLSLREALSIARKGDTITFDESLADGTIKLKKSELTIAESLTIDASGLNITITPASSNASRIFHIAKGVESAELIGLTITGGNVTGNGGAILAELFVGLSLTDCTVSSSIATESGGGIYLACGSLSLQNCVVTGNSASDYGGAVYVRGGTLTLDTVRLTNNSAGSYTGGIYAYYTQLTAVNTLIANNSAYRNGGVYIEGKFGKFTNCTITQNYASNEGFTGGGFLVAGGGAVNLYNSIVCVNYTAFGVNDIQKDSGTVNGYNTLSDFTAWNSSDSCITYDATLPLFQNRAAGDFSLAANSQAVNLGENDYVSSKTDLAGNRRIVSGTVDLGAYESFAWSWRGYADGNAHSVVVSKKLKTDTVSFSVDGGQTWSETNPEFTKVGSYSVMVKLERSGYADWTANLTVDILAKDALIVTTLDDVVDEEDDDLSLREALSIARNGDTITFDESLADGVIKLKRAELMIAESLTIDASGLNITITPSAGNSSRIFHIAKGVESAKLIGLTMTGGNAAGNGGAVLAELFAGLSLKDCTISSSSAAGSGGAVYLACGSLNLQNCTVTGNSASSNGGAVYVQGGTLTLDTVRVTNNSASRYTGGIYARYTRLTAVNTLAANNSARDYGGVCVEGVSGNFTNCTIAQNYSSEGSVGGLLVNGGATVNLYNSIVCGNYCYRGTSDIVKSGTVNGYNTLSDFTAWTTSESCTTYDATLPLFQNRAAGDFSLAANSQAAGFGNNDYVSAKTDLAGNRRIVSGTVDLGAYESFAWSWRGYADGKPHSVIVSAKQKSDTLSFSIDGGETWTETNPEFTNVGSYSVMVKLERSGYADWTADLSVDILAKDALVVTTLDDVVNDEDDLLSLREALLIAQNGDTITFDKSLKDGIVTLKGSELTIAQSLTIDAAGLNITITPSASSSSRIFHIAKGVESADLIGLTMTGGKVAGNGGAILAERFAGLSLTDCTISSSSAAESGGAVYLSCGSLSLKNCVVNGNTASGDGGAVYVQGGTLTLDSVQVINNSAENASGGVFAYYTSLIAVNTLIANNNGDENHGGVYIEGQSGSLTNCTITQNYSSNKWASGVGLYARYNATVNLYNSIVYGNYSPQGARDIDGSNINGYNTLSDFTGWSASESCVTYDAVRPLFKDSENGDFSLAAKSQAINIGGNDYVSSKTDLAGNDRIVGMIVDLGAYEYQDQQPKITDVSLAGWSGPYDGQGHSVTLTDPHAATDTITYFYNGESSETNPVFVNPGIYYVTVTVEREGYSTWRGTTSVTIESIEIAVNTKITVTSSCPTVTESDDPLSEETAALGETFYVSVWVKSGNPDYGVQGGYCSLHYGESVTPVSYYASSLFSESIAVGFDGDHITGFGGVPESMTAAYGADIWVLAGTYSFTADEAGMVTFSTGVATKNGVEKPSYNFILENGENTNSYDSISIEVVERRLDTPVFTTGNKGIFVSYGANRHQLAWGAVTGAESYEVSYSADGKSWKTVTSSTNSAVIKGLTYGTDVQYKVRAVAGSTTSDWSTVKTFNVCPMDVNGDGDIAVADRSLVSGAWLSSEGDDEFIAACDINGDGDVAGADRNFLSSNWLCEAGDEDLVYPKAKAADAAIAEFVSDFGIDLEIF